MDIGLGTLLGSVVSGIGGLIGQSQANQVNREIASQNIAFQQRENEITREREDNAVWRASQDMVHSGLSKTLAAGSPASASALTAPQNNMQYQSPIGKAVEKMNLVNSFLQAKQTEAQIKSVDAEAGYKQALTAGQNLSNGVFMQKHENEQALTLANTEMTKAHMDLYRSEERLNTIVGDSKAEYLRAQIDNLLSDTKYKNMSTSKASHEIMEIISRTNKLDTETELVLQDIVYRGLQIRSLRTDIDYAKKFGLPVGHLPGGLLGGAWNIGTMLRTRVRDVLGKSSDFTFSPTPSGNYIGYSPSIDAEAWNLINNSGYPF